MVSSLKSKNKISFLHFERFEFKYIVTNKFRYDLEDYLKKFLILDSFVQNTENNQYYVKSLYFDDLNLRAFHSKIDGLHTRNKFRIRTYDKIIKSDTNYFLEDKGRFNNLVYKSRYQFKNHKFMYLKGDTLCKEIVNLTINNKILNDFKYKYYLNKLLPIAIIEYQRRPYISKYDPTFRLTFDDNIISKKKNSIINLDNCKQSQVLSGCSIIEVKFKKNMPSWFHRSIQAFELNRISISKICAGMEALGLAYDENG
jgi:hypothetical protein